MVTLTALRPQETAMKNHTRGAGISLLLALFLAASLTPACAAAPVPSPGKGSVSSANPREHMGKGGYRITGPEGWEKNDIGGAIDVTFLCAADPGVNISVAWASAGGEVSLTAASAREMVEMFRKSYPGYEMTAEEWRELDGAKAYCLSARYAPMGTPLQNKQVMLIKGGKFFTITYTSTPALFMKYLGAFEEAVATFRTTGTPAPAVVKSPQIKKN